MSSMEAMKFGMPCWLFHRRSSMAVIQCFLKAFELAYSMNLYDYMYKVENLEYFANKTKQRDVASEMGTKQRRLEFAHNYDRAMNMLSQLELHNAHCDMTANAGGWILIARFSNADGLNWMRDDAYWWYDIQSSQGSPTSTSDNYDMISEAFWRVSGSEIKITRSDDSSHTVLLQTYSNCLYGNSIRGLLSSYGRFTYLNYWSNDNCLRNCPVYYGGWYSSTEGFSKAHCDGNIQSSNYIGFWCQWGTGDGSVMMIGGGGGYVCNRADHGIGITENDNGGAFDDQIREQESMILEMKPTIRPRLLTR